ncbi:hypothetical protein [Stenotrophobium rhamnosiphilum]|uniref:Lipoprotein n=1 Tax=Stenotrophobium rhamnosiphilum TaxID=2029166 RepID=A0A2T5ME70_9GAMM|nr:hypothetical protein [Stenotrophobium rhamnosiphilum]PTU30839.1 hypothetical protein CJD38_11040 [Stenotrophobium rhamnosiphilum]
MKIQFALTLVLAASVTGCASSAHCVGEQEYQRAYSLQPPELQGLKMPTSSAALVIPAPVAQMVPFASKTKDGSIGEKKGMQCLDAPPRMVPTPNKS